MRHLRTACAAAVLTSAVAATVAASASANVYCVAISDPSCSAIAIPGATPGARLVSAFSLAAANPGADAVRFGPGTYDATGFAPTGGGAALDVIGPGAALATLRYPTAGASAATTVSTGDNVTASGFSVELPPTTSTAYGIYAGASAPRLTDVAVVDPTPGAPFQPLRYGIGLNGGGTLTDVRISAPKIGVNVTGTGVTTVTGATITAGNYGVLVNQRTNADQVSIGAARLTTTKTDPAQAVVGLAVWSGTVAARNVDVGGTGTAVVQLCDTDTALTLSRVTLDPGPGREAFVQVCGVEADRAASATIADSLLVPPASLVVESLASRGTASTTLARTRWDGPASLTTSGPRTTATTGGLVTTAPAFVSASDRHLAPGSPLIDGLPAAAGTPELGAATDPDGGFLRRDGDGDGIARRDFGAFENQPAAPAPPAANLLLSPGAEAPGAAADDSSSPSLPTGWTRTAGSFTFARYGTSFFPRQSLATLLGAGGSFFVGGPGAAVSKAQQVVDLSASAAGIDGGGASATLSALLGGYATESDSGTITAAFRAADGSTLGTIALGPVTRDQRDDSTLLMPAAGSRAIPVGTRTVVVELVATRVGADPYNDASFDQLSLTAAIPAVRAPVGGGDDVRPQPVPPAPPVPPIAASGFRGVTLRGGRARLDARGRVTLPVGCPAAAQTRCTGTLKATVTTRVKVARRVKGKRRTVTVTRTIALGSARLGIAAGVTQNVRLTIAAAQRRRIARAGLGVTVTAAARDGAGGRAVTTTARATLLPARAASASRRAKRR